MLLWHIYYSFSYNVQYKYNVVNTNFKYGIKTIRLHVWIMAQHLTVIAHIAESNIYIKAKTHYKTYWEI